MTKALICSFLLISQFSLAANPKPPLKTQKQSEPRSLGLKQGDILVGVNELELTNSEKGLEAFEKLNSNKPLKLQIIRKGKKQTLITK